MKPLVLLLFSTTFQFAGYSQLEFSVAGQVVDQSQVYYHEFDTAQWQFVEMDITNMTNSVVNLDNWVCLIQDDPNIEMSIHEWGNHNDAFSWIHGPVNFSTSSCWPGGLWNPVHLEPGEVLSIKTYFDVYDNGCERFKYRIFQDSVAVDSILIETCSTVGLMPNELSELNIFPNPSSGSFQINSEYLINDVQLTDETGRRIEVDRNGDQVTIQQAREGIYFLKFITDNGILTRKLSIVK